MSFRRRVWVIRGVCWTAAAILAGSGTVALMSDFGAPLPERAEVLSITWSPEGEFRNSLNKHGLQSEYVVRFDRPPSASDLDDLEPLVVELAQRSCFVTRVDQTVVRKVVDPEKKTVARYRVEFTDRFPSGKLGRVGPPGSPSPSRVYYEDGEWYPDGEK